MLWRCLSTAVLWGPFGWMCVWGSSEKVPQQTQSSREAHACVTEPPSQRQVFRLIRAKQNRQKADANNNSYNTSASCGRQPGISRRSDRVLEWQRLCLKFDGENYGEDQCWTFRVQINISFKSFILLCMVWSAVENTSYSCGMKIKHVLGIAY